jgi:tetratricopeptide (TPR) repeat protein
MSHPTEPPRWSQGGASSPEEQRAARLFEAARPLPPLPVDALARAELQVSASLAEAGLAPWAKVALASVALAGGAGLYLWKAGPPEASSQAFVQVEQAAVSLAAVELPLPDQVPLPPPVVEPAPESAELAAPVIPAPGRRVRKEQPARTAGGDLGREAALIDAALRHLYAEDPPAVLAQLDTYEREFPEGQLSLEAKAARVEALAALGRHAEALALLDRHHADFSGLPRAKERSVLRAELLLELQRPREALALFEAALAADERHERALRGRAITRRALGDQAGAARDARRYLEQFPRGFWTRELSRLADP